MVHTLLSPWLQMLTCFTPFQVPTLPSVMDLFQVMTDLLEQLLDTPSLHPILTENTHVNTNAFFLTSGVMSASLARLPALGAAGGHWEKGANSSREPHILEDGEEGGSDSEERGWVRRHVLNWHSWMVSVTRIAPTVMVKLGYLLSAGSGTITWAYEHLWKSLKSSIKRSDRDDRYWQWAIKCHCWCWLKLGWEVTVYCD